MHAWYVYPPRVISPHTPLPAPAATTSYAPAQNDLGGLYRSGCSVPQDVHEAARWYRMAAEQGNATGQHNLGLM